MPDGSILQDRDPLTVSSARRNPVLADVFNRLGYMERKDSVTMLKIDKKNIAYHKKLISNPKIFY